METSGGLEMPVLLSILSGQAIRGMAGEGRRTPWYRRDGGFLLLKSLGVEVRGKETGPPGNVGALDWACWVVRVPPELLQSRGPCWLLQLAVPPAIGSIFSVHVPALPQAHREIQSAVICGVLPSVLPVLPVLQSFEADVFLWYQALMPGFCWCLYRSMRAARGSAGSDRSHT